MSIDGYSTCPCHIEKKIKFCCGKDVLHDLNEAIAKSQSGQVVAAMDQLDRAIKKLGPRDCLVTMKTHLLLNAGRLEEARQTNDEFLQRSPDNFMGRQLQALICAGEGDVECAIKAIQDALDILDSEEVDNLPVSLAAPCKIVGIMLMERGNLLAARKYFMFAEVLKNQEDEELRQLSVYSYTAPGIPPYLKAQLDMDLVESEDLGWAKSYNNAVKLRRRGQFRLANRLLTKLDELHTEQPEIIKGLATTYLCLNQLAEATEQLHRLARLAATPREQAIEAEVLAQHFDVDIQDRVEVVLITHELTDLERAFELLDQSGKSITIPSEVAHMLREGAPPKHAMTWLDRPLEDVSQEGPVPVDELPQMSATLALYGKRTDRPALLLILGQDVQEFESSLAELRELLADVLTGEEKREVFAELTVEDFILKPRLYLPRDSEGKSVAVDSQDIAEHLIRNQLVKTPLKVFAGKAADEFAKELDDERRIRIEGWIFRVGLSDAGVALPVDTIASLFDVLNLDPPPSVPEERVEEAVMQPVRARMIDLDELDDRMLGTMIRATEVSGDRVLHERVLRTFLKRDSDEAKQIRPFVLNKLATLTDDDDEALEFLHQARKLLQSEGQPVGMLLVSELDQRLSRGLVDSLDELFQLIVNRHLDDANVERALMSVLQKYGIDVSQAQGAAPVSPSMGVPVGGQNPGGAAAPEIWTPDQPPTSETPASADEPEKSKLWIPGQD